VTDLSDFKRVVYEPEVQALREKLAAALDREAGTQDALDDALRRVAELESHLGQSEQYRQATQDERDYYRAQRDKQREGREADRRILKGFRDKAERRVTELEAENKRLRLYRERIEGLPEGTLAGDGGGA
jgi:chromosome segregation ATPase